MKYRVYPATAIIKHKTTNAVKSKRGNSRIKMYAIPQNIKIKAHALIEKIANNDFAARHRSQDYEARQGPREPNVLDSIFMKLWSLSDKAESLIKRYFEEKEGRTIFNDKIKNVTPF